MGPVSHNSNYIFAYIYRPEALCLSWLQLHDNSKEVVLEKSSVGVVMSKRTNSTKVAYTASLIDC